MNLHQAPAVGVKVARRRNVNPQPLGAASVPGALLDLRTVGAVTGLSRSTIYRLIGAENFPAGVRVSDRCRRWKSDEVAEWCASR